MKREVMEQWVQALRSGKWKKGESRLESWDGEYCCLGVLCWLAQADGVAVERTVERIVNLDADTIYYGGSCVHLPWSVMCWAGMGSGEGHYGAGEEDTLAFFNDRQPTWAPVIDLIEEKWEDL